jgi:hypothetical protein
MKIIPNLAPIVAPDFVSIPVDLSKLEFPPRIASNYVRKEEFHETLVGKGHGLIRGLELTRSMTRDQAERSSMHACRMALDDVRFTVRLLPRLFKVEKAYREPTPHTRRSVIALCEVESAGPGGRSFHEILSILYGASVEPPPFHMTLYTYEDEMSRKGIGIVEQWELEHHAKETSDPDIVRPLSVLC